MTNRFSAILSVHNGKEAVAFYQRAFGAQVLQMIEDPSGAIVSKLSAEGVEFWVADESPEHQNFSPQTLGGGSVKLLLMANDPDHIFGQAVAAGAIEVVPICDQYGWRLGRVLDPFGHHWEIGKELD